MPFIARLVANYSKFPMRGSSGYRVTLASEVRDFERLSFRFIVPTEWIGAGLTRNVVMALRFSPSQSRVRARHMAG